MGSPFEFIAAIIIGALTLAAMACIAKGIEWGRQEGIIEKKQGWEDDDDEK